MKLHSCIAALWALSLGCGQPHQNDRQARNEKLPSLESPLRDRHSFQAQLAKIDEGDSQERVLQLLGPPDDKWTAADPTEYGGGVTDVTWCYGTNGHLTMPTLGRVAFKAGAVQWCTTGHKLSAANLFDELELRQILRKFWAPPTRWMFYDGDDPRWLIRTANALIPLGKERAFSVIREAEALGSGGNLHWLIRTVCEVPTPPGYLRVPMIGAISPSPPADLTTNPRFPVVILNDIPFVIPTGVTLSGVAERASWYLDEEGPKLQLRTSLLHPPDDPFVSCKALIADKRWLSGSDGLDQVLRLVRNAMPTEQADMPDFRQPTLDYDVLHARFLALKPFWSERLQMYVRGDGSFEDDVDRRLAPVRWSVELGNARLDAACERRGSFVELSCDWTEAHGLIQPAVLVITGPRQERLYSIALRTGGGFDSNPDVVLTEQAHEANEFGAGYSGGFRLPAGSEITLELRYGTKVRKQAKFRI